MFATTLQAPSSCFEVVLVAGDDERVVGDVDELTAEANHVTCHLSAPNGIIRAREFPQPEQSRARIEGCGSTAAAASALQHREWIARMSGARGNFQTRPAHVP